MILRAHSRIASHFGIHLHAIFGRSSIADPRNSTLFLRSAQSVATESDANLGANSVKLFLSGPLVLPTGILRWLFRSQSHQRWFEALDFFFQLRTGLLRCNPVTCDRYGFQLMRRLEGFFRPKVAHRTFQGVGGGVPVPCSPSVKRLPESRTTTSGNRPGTTPQAR